MIYLKIIFGSDKPPATTPESLRILYTEVTNVIHIYYEWRHKVISFYLAALSAFGVLAGWISDHPSFHQYLPHVLVFFGIISLILLLMDRVNTSVLQENFAIAKNIEEKMNPGQNDISIYSHPHKQYQNIKYIPTEFGTYAFILFWLYLLSAIISFLLAIYLYNFPIKLSSQVDNKCFCCTEISEKKCIVNKVH